MAAQTQQLDLEGIKTIQISLRNGGVVVHGEAGKNEVTLTSIEADNYKIEQDGSTLRIRSKHKLFDWSNAGADMNVDLSLTVPVNLEIEAGSGELRIDGPLLSLQVQMGEGSVTASNAGKVEVKNGAGAVNVSHNKGDVAAKLGSGTVNLADIEGVVVVHSGSSEVKLQDIVGSLDIGVGSQSVDGESITLTAGSQNLIRTGGQHVRLSGLSAPAGVAIDGKTHDGPIKLNLKSYETSQQKKTFQATLAGDNQAQLHIETPGEINLSS